MSDLLTFREATREDLPQLVHMLADDVLGAQREQVRDPLPGAYHDAFEEISVDPNNVLLVAEDGTGKVVAMLQLTFIPGLSRGGAWRAQIEGVRVDAAARGRGIGRLLVADAIARAARRECRLVQLTTDKQRPDALRFYTSLGFSATHEGLKLFLSSPSEPHHPALSPLQAR